MLSHPRTKPYGLGVDMPRVERRRRAEARERGGRSLAVNRSLRVERCAFVKAGGGILTGCPAPARRFPVSVFFTAFPTPRRRCGTDNSNTRGRQVETGGAIGRVQLVIEPQRTPEKPIGHI
eukprot:7113186-Prymnesium_polylepis.1